MRVIFRANTITTQEAWRAKKARLRSVGELGAIQIAETVNTSLIAAAFPGRIRETIRAEVGAPSNALSLGRVVGIVDKPLFWWYVKGTATYIGKEPYPINPIRASALMFYWAKAGETVVFRHVENPGTRPHEVEYAAFIASLRSNAYETWHLLLNELLRG